MTTKFLIACIIFFSFILKIQANEKQSIINYLSGIQNFTFNFEQITNGKIENGNCLIVFDNKLKCNYDDKLQKEIIINNKTLVILQKRYNKIYFYPISKSPFLNILNKDKLMNLVKKSDLIVKDNLELVFVDTDQKKIKVFFEKENYTLIGWLIEDELQNKSYFSLKINKTNIEVDNNAFKIPIPN